MGLLEFLIDLILLTEQWSWGLLSLYQKREIGYLLGWAVKADGAYG